MKPRNSPIWEHFIESTKPENSNGSIVLCQINGCWNILKAPLRRKPKVDSFFTLSSSFASPGGRTPAPVSSTSTRDNEDKKMHLLIPKMIILDFEPFSLVERPGFLSLLHSLNRNYVVRSWKFYTELLPAKSLYKWQRTNQKATEGWGLSDCCSSNGWLVSSSLWIHWCHNNLHHQELEEGYPGFRQSSLWWEPYSPCPGRACSKHNGEVGPPDLI